jgi:hypothetical protein
MAKQKGKKKPTRIMEKVWVKAFLMLLSVALMFMGPTYFLYVLQKFVASYNLLVLLGLASFAFGVVLFAFVFSQEKGKG